MVGSGNGSLSGVKFFDFINLYSQQLFSVDILGSFSFLYNFQFLLALCLKEIGKKLLIKC